MNRQRKVVITVTYNELGTIVDTKAEELDLSAQPERKTGRWITSDDLYETGICSCCKHDSQEPVSYAVTNFHFCPNCGVDMRGSDAE